MIDNFSTAAFNQTAAISTHVWNEELIVTLLTIIAFCEIMQLIMKLGGYVLK